MEKNLSGIKYADAMKKNNTDVLKTEVTKNCIEKDMDNETLSRDHPISEFLRQQKDALKSMTQEEFQAKFDNHIKNNEQHNQTASKPKPLIKKEFKSDSDQRPGILLNNIVLKFTTLSENSAATPSFNIGCNGAKIGRDSCNEVSVPSDLRLAPDAHTIIEYDKGSFYISDNGFDNSASLRIGSGGLREHWILEVGARFSAGNSVFRSLGEDDDGNLIIEIIEGPLKGSKKIINRKIGANFGRSSDNTISVPDRELSRRHSRIEYNKKLGRFIVIDIGSTNGTYMQLVGPFGGLHKLHLNDHILVGRTGFSINRFDYGLSEEVGTRHSMEDACTVIQHLDIPELNCISSLAPQSFFAVFDGHGGAAASLYLAQHLHFNIAKAITQASDRFNAIFEEEGKSLEDAVTQMTLDGTNRLDKSAAKQVDEVVCDLLKTVFLSTDAEFINTSKHPQHGSTATTAMMLGNQLYCANVGDSRTMLCRGFKPLPLSQDHKPGREDEARRIRAAGGFVINNRVMGELAVSRAFGDSEFKKSLKESCEDGKLDDSGDEHAEGWDEPLVIAEPEIQCATLCSDDQFLLLACDGLFDVFNPTEVVDFIISNLRQHGDVHKCCQNLTNEAIRVRHSRDNVTVVLVIVNRWY